MEAKFKPFWHLTFQCLAFQFQGIMEAKQAAPKLLKDKEGGKIP